MNDDKIYARIVCDEFGCEVRASLKNNGGKEYIRKEALLEWIENEIQALSDGSLSGYYISLAYQDMREHLNGM